MSAAENEHLRIDHFDEDVKIPGLERLSAEIGDKSCGDLDYHWSFEDECWELVNISVTDEFRGKGIARALFGAFIKYVGPGQSVHFGIIHEETVRKIKKKYQETLNGGKYRISGEELQTLPLVRGIERTGYLKIELITVDHNSMYYLDVPDIDVWGRTSQPQPLP